jgi:hypothetical protein
MSCWMFFRRCSLFRSLLQRSISRRQMPTAWPPSNSSTPRSLARRLSSGNTWVASSFLSSLKSRKVLERNTRISRDSGAAGRGSGIGFMQQLHSCPRGSGVEGTYDGCLVPGPFAPAKHGPVGSLQEPGVDKGPRQSLTVLFAHPRQPEARPPLAAHHGRAAAPNRPALNHRLAAGSSHGVRSICFRKARAASSSLSQASHASSPYDPPISASQEEWAMHAVSVRV